MWCKDLTDCLMSKESDILEAVKGAEQRCFNVNLIRVE